MLLLLLIFYILFIFYQYNQYCEQEQAVDQGLYSEMVYITHDYTSHINSYPVQVDDDLYCNAVQAIDQGLHTELVCNYV